MFYASQVESSAVAAPLVIPSDNDDPETVMESYTFELEPHEDPDATLAYVKKLSKIVGDHIGTIHMEVFHNTLNRSLIQNICTNFNARVINHYAAFK